MVNVPSNLKLLLCGSVVACACLAAPALAQDANEVAYHSLMQQIDNKKMNIAHNQAVINYQNEKIASLNGQLGSVDELKSSVEPMLEKMVSNIEREINADYPFEYDVRMHRVIQLKELMAKPEASVGEKYSHALHIYEVEVNYGQSVVAKDGDHPLTPTIREGDDRYKRDENGEIEINKKTNQKVPIFDGTYLRYGRVSYIYINNDGSSPLRYDLKGKANEKWVPMKGSTVSVRMAIRVAKGEVATTVVMAPVMPAN